MLLLPLELHSDGRTVVLTKNGEQSRTLPELSFSNDWKLFPFANGLDDRQIEVKDISVKLIKFNHEVYVVNEELPFENVQSIGVRDTLVTYSILFRSDAKPFKLTLSLEWDSTQELSLGLWDQVKKLWDKQFIEESKQLSLPLSSVTSMPSSVVSISATDEQVNVDDYDFAAAQLEGARGPLTGTALTQRKLKLIRTGQVTLKEARLGFDI
jgi:hypothetical protein